MFLGIAAANRSANAGSHRGSNTGAYRRFDGSTAPRTHRNARAYGHSRTAVEVVRGS